MTLLSNELAYAQKVLPFLVSSTRIYAAELYAQFDIVYGLLKVIEENVSGPVPTVRSILTHSRSNLTTHSFISSKPFLVFGPQKTLFYAHSDLLARSSRVFSRDVHGDMQEKQLETIEIKDVDGDIDDDTVLRFLEYAYSGDYTVPDPDIVQPSTDSKELQEAFVPQTSMALEDEWAVPVSGKKDKKKKKRTSMLEYTLERDLSPDHQSSLMESVTEAVQHVQGMLGPTIQVVDWDRQRLWDSFCSSAHIVERQPWRPRDENNEREDYTNIFLCHARLYKFADRYGCEQLMALALQKLRLTLSQYIFYPQRVSDIVNLIRYTYAHTMNLDHGQDRLRALVLDLTICYYRELIGHPLFVKLLQEGGSLPTDVMVGIARIVS